jgi:hypothetical protein
MNKKKKKRMDLEQLEHDDEKISYFKLKNHIENSHPYKRHDKKDIKE